MWYFVCTDWVQHGTHSPGADRAGQPPTVHREASGLCSIDGVVKDDFLIGRPGRCRASSGSPIKSRIVGAKLRLSKVPPYLLIAAQCLIGRRRPALAPNATRCGKNEPHRRIESANVEVPVIVGEDVWFGGATNPLLETAD